MACWRLFLIWNFAYLAAPGFQSSAPYHIAIVLSLIWPVRFGIMEFLRWLHEIYVVCRNDERGGGALYKFSGVFSQKGITDPITDKSPAVSYSTPWRYRVWGFLTGEHMERVHVSSDNNAYIDGNRVPPDFDRSIKRVRGSSPRPGPDDFPTMYMAQRMVFDALGRGLIEEREAKDYNRTVLWNTIYGD
ncbi:MAG: hypothetical protein A2W25_11755 [candidate division Zixibacteria bacterium RBG_16_53_22]|nr:MAG: hypothetical protein A2W25_11755 [candidate division Zixibacteria bacterium RBG_16_53_22]